MPYILTRVLSTLKLFIYITLLSFLFSYEAHSSNSYTCDKLLSLSSKENISVLSENLAKASIIKKSILEGKRSLKEYAQDALIDLVSRESSVDLNQEFDLIFVGASLAETTAQMRLNQYENHNLKVLTLEKTDTVAPLYSQAGQFFYLSSSARDSQDGRFQKLMGEVNQIPNSPLNLSDISFTRFPIGSDLGHLITLVRGFFSKNPILFGAEVVGVDRRPDKKIRVLLQDGRVITTKKLIFSSGMGEEKTHFGNNLSRLLKTEATKDKPRVETFLGAAKRSALVDHPFEDYVDKKIAVIGAGNGGNTVVSWLLRLGPEKSYARDPVSLGYPDKIVWYGQRCQNCIAYTSSNSAQYANVGSGYSDRIIDPVFQEVVDVFDNGFGGLVVVSKFRRSAKDKYAEPEYSTRVVDKVIVSTGYVPQLSKVLKTNEYHNLTVEDKKLVEDIDSFSDSVLKTAQEFQVRKKQKLSGIRKIRSESFQIEIPHNSGLMGYVYVNQDKKTSELNLRTIASLFADFSFKFKRTLKSKDLHSIAFKLNFNEESENEFKFFARASEDAPLVEVYSMSFTEAELIKIFKINEGVLPKKVIDSNKNLNSIFFRKVHLEKTFLNLISAVASVPRNYFSDGGRQLFKRRATPETISYGKNNREIVLAKVLDPVVFLDNTESIYAIGTAATDNEGYVDEEKSVGDKGISNYQLSPKTSAFIDYIMKSLNTDADSQ